MLTFSLTRAAIVLLLLGGGLAGMTGRIAYLQTVGRERTLRCADRQQHRDEILSARRGSIFDANGILMACTVQTRVLYIDPKFMRAEFAAQKRTPQQVRQSLRKLAELIDKDPLWLDNLLVEKADDRYVKLVERLDERIVKEILALKIPGVGTEPLNVRNYPMGSLGAHVLGTVGKDDSGRAERGLEGLELYFEKTLAGRDGRKREIKDASRRPIGVLADDYLPPLHGQHLILTLDANIQMIAEQELAAACQKNKAKRGEVIVMDPRTGDILALANWPTFNPQNVVQEESGIPDREMLRRYQSIRRNRAVTDPYEPGSTIKPFIVGPALAWAVTKLTEIWPIPGKVYTTPYGRQIKDVHGYPPLSMWDVLVKSSNIGMSLLAARMGNPKLHKALVQFGFGRRTGIELPGEDPGLVNPLGRWGRASTESVAQGYEMMVTPVQLCRAFCVYANGGYLVQPRLIKGVLDAEGRVVSRRAAPRLDMLPQVLDRATADGLRQTMCDVVVRGTGTKARSRLWNIFGKTGTSHISLGRAGYSSEKYNSSFMCGAPYENPRIVVTTIIHEADRSIAHYGGTVSAPPSQRIVERTLSYLQIPQSPDLQPPPPQIARVLLNFNPRLYVRPADPAARSANGSRTAGGSRAPRSPSASAHD